MPVPGRNTAVLVDQFDMGQYFNSFEFEREGERIDVTRFGRKLKQFLAGPQEGTVTLSGFADFGPDEVDDVFHRVFGRDEDVLITLCADTYAFGKSAYLTPTTEVTYNLSAEVEDACEIEGEFAINGSADRGRILKTLAPVTATGMGTAVVDDAATAKGASAHLHVTAISGAPTSVEVKVEHSADGTTWADLITFDAVTAPVGQRKVTIPTATVDEQLRVSWTITGGTTPSVTFAVAVARLV